MPRSIADATMTLRQPGLEDGAAVWRLVQATQPLDPNACYAYLLLCTHFADTCVVAEEGDELLGFVSAYCPPTAHDVLFVWQVAVKSTARGKGIANAMIRSLLDRDVCERVAFLEATVTPSNIASRTLFRSLARAYNTVCKETCWFPASAFGGDQHEDEILFRIGPLSTR